MSTREVHELQPGEMRACPICGAPGEPRFERSFDPARVDSMTFASRKQPELMHWSMAECVRCDLMFALDPPAFELLRDAYADAGFDADRESDAAALTYASVVERMILRPLGWGHDRLRVLDVGCGDGAFLARMHDAGASRVVGIEISDAPIRRARPEIRDVIERCMIEEYEGKDFTIATGFQVWEHFSAPRQVMEALRDTVVPGGLVLGVVHDRRALANRLMRRKSPIWDVEHLQLFSPKSVRALVEAAGMRLVRVQHIANTYAADYWLRLAPLPPALRGPLRRLVRPGGREIRVPMRVGNLAFIAQQR